VDLRGYKTLASIYPQARLGSGAANLLINAGASDTFNVLRRSRLAISPTTAST
jgi:hypothetical protein